MSLPVALSILSALLALLGASCADPAPPPAATPAAAAAVTVADAGAAPDAAGLPPLPRSSIAAVIQHRAELALTDDQVRELEVRDQEREKEDAAVRAEVERKRKQAQDAKASPGNGAGNPGGGRGGGMGGGMRGGGMRGGGMGGGRAPHGASAPTDHEPSAQERMDENDTKAYLDAEEALEGKQKERARDIASDFREKLYERREALRAQGGAK